MTSESQFISILSADSQLKFLLRNSKLFKTGEDVLKSFRFINQSARTFIRKYANNTALPFHFR